MRKIDSDANWKLIPEHMQESIRSYIEERLEPGGFLTAVLSNDLTQAVLRADAININRLPNYVQFLYWHVPSESWGSPERVTAWLKEEEAA